MPLDHLPIFSAQPVAAKPGEHPVWQRLLDWNPEAVVAGKFDRGELTLTIAAALLPAVAEYLRDDSQLRFDLLADVTAVDRVPNHPRFEVNYHLYCLARHEWLRLKVWTEPEQPIPSVSGIWPSANWHEREVWDLFGVRFSGHPFLRRILMPDNWEGHPMRKDYPVEGYR